MGSDCNLMLLVAVKSRFASITKSLGCTNLCPIFAQQPQPKCGYNRGMPLNQ